MNVDMIYRNTRAKSLDFSIRSLMKKDSKSNFLRQNFYAEKINFMFFHSFFINFIHKTKSLIFRHILYLQVKIHIELDHIFKRNNTSLQSSHLNKGQYSS